jgi:lauroyl/myristoyl acyltransferase
MPLLRQFGDFVGRIQFPLHLEILRRLPLAWVFAWLRLYSRLKFRLLGWRRRDAIRKMQATLPDGTSPDVIRSLALPEMTNYTFRQHLDYLLMSLDIEDLRDLLEVEGWERVDEAIARGHGAVILFGHVGFPRLLRWYLRGRAGTTRVTSSGWGFARGVYLRHGSTVFTD